MGRPPGSKNKDPYAAGAIASGTPTPTVAIPTKTKEEQALALELAQRRVKLARRGWVIPKELK